MTSFGADSPDVLDKIAADRAWARAKQARIDALLRRLLDVDPPDPPKENNDGK